MLCVVRVSDTHTLMSVRVSETVCCSALQCVAVRCSALQGVAVCCSVCVRYTHTHEGARE